MIDLTNYPKTQNAQTSKSSKQINDLVAIANITPDDFESKVLEINENTILIEGDYSTIENRYAVVGGEIIRLINFISYSPISNITEFSITRENFGTKEVEGVISEKKDVVLLTSNDEFLQEFNNINLATSEQVVVNEGYAPIIRTVTIFNNIKSFQYDTNNSSKTEVFPFSLESGKVELFGDISKWKEEYIIKPRKTAVYLFKGYEGENLLKYTGFAYEKTSYSATRATTQHTSIKFNDKFIKWFDREIEKDIKFKNVYPKQLIANLLDYDEEMIYYANEVAEQSFNNTNYLFSKDYNTYGDLLKSVAKSGVRICFDELERIKITTDFEPSSLSLSKEIPITDVDITDIQLSSEDKLIINSIEGEFYDRLPLYNMEELNNRAVDYVYTYNNINYTMLEKSEDDFYYYNLLIIEELPNVNRIDIGDIVILKDQDPTQSLEFHGKIVNITSEGYVEIVIGYYDKDSKLNVFGKDKYLDGLGYTFERTFDLFYLRNQLPIVYKHQSAFEGNDKSSNLRVPLIPQVQGESENILTYKANFGAMSDLEVGSFTGYYEEIEGAYGNFTETDLSYNREIEQFDGENPPIFALSNRITTPLGNTEETILEYDIYDNSNLSVEVNPIKDFNANITFRNIEVIQPEELIEIKSGVDIEMKGGFTVKVTSAKYQELNVGDVIKLKEPTSYNSIQERNEFSNNRDTSWIILNMFESEGDFFFNLNGNIRDTFDWVVYPATSVVYLQEFYIMGNPIIEHVSPFIEQNLNSIQLYEEKSYKIEGDLLDERGLRRLIDYYKSGFGGIGEDKKFILPVSIRNNIELQKYDVIKFNETIYTDFNDDRLWMVLGENGQDCSKGNVNNYVLMNLNVEDVQEDNISLQTLLKYRPVSDTDYNHRGNEGSEVENREDIAEGSIVSAIDDQYGFVAFKPLDQRKIRAKIQSIDNNVISLDTTISETLVTVKTSKEFDGDILFSRVGSNFVYVAISDINKIFKINKLSLEVEEESVGFTSEICCMEMDDDYIYIGATEQPGQTIKKLRKSDLVVESESISYLGIEKMTLSDNYILFVDEEYPQGVRRLNKSDLTSSLDNLDLGEVISAIHCDNQFLYVSTSTGDFPMWKINIDTLTIEATTTFLSSAISYITSTDLYIFVASISDTTIAKFRKSDLGYGGFVGSIGLSVNSLEIYSNMIYSTGINNEVLKIDENLNLITKTKQYNGTIKAIGIDEDNLYIGGDTSRVITKIESNNFWLPRYQKILSNIDSNIIIKADNEYILCSVKEKDKLTIVKRNFVNSESSRLYQGLKVTFKDIVSMNIDGNLVSKSIIVGDSDSKMEYNEENGLLIQADNILISNENNILNFSQKNDIGLIQLNKDETTGFFSQQMGSGLEDSVNNGLGAYSGFFVGDPDLDNRDYIKYVMDGNLEIDTYKIKIKDTNVFLGEDSGLNTQATGTDNIGLGFSSLKENTTGGRNIALGVLALERNTTGHDNIALGLTSLKYNTSGNRNIALGSQSLKYNKTGFENIAIGTQSLRDSETSVGCIAIGNTSLVSATNNYNIAIGSGAGSSVTTGEDNVLIGAFAGTYAETELGAFIELETGSNNVCIGKLSGVSASDADNEIVLGNYAHTVLRCNVNTITSLSDKRDKKDISDIELGLDFIKELKPSRFTWDRRDGSFKDKKAIGFVAQDLLEVVNRYNAKHTDLVYENNPNKLEIAEGKLIPILTKAIQEQQKIIDELVMRIERLENN